MVECVIKWKGTCTYNYVSCLSEREGVYIQYRCTVQFKSVWCDNCHKWIVVYTCWCTLKAIIEEDPELGLYLDEMVATAELARRTKVFVPISTLHGLLRIKLLGLSLQFCYWWINRISFTKKWDWKNPIPKCLDLNARIVIVSDTRQVRVVFMLTRSHA